MKPNIVIDTRQFNQAMREYAEVSKREWSEIVNRKALQLAFEALKETPKADKEAIRTLHEKEWWPKYIAKRISGGVSYSQMRKGVRSTVTVKGRHTRAMAMEVSRRIIAARVRSTAFLKAGWIPAIKRLYPLVRDKAGLRSGSVGGARQYGVDKGRVTVARPSNNPFAEIVNSADGIQKIGPAALQRALNFVERDTRDYIARKMQKVTSRFNAI